MRPGATRPPCRIRCRPSPWSRRRWTQPDGGSIRIPEYLAGRPPCDGDATTRELGHRMGHSAAASMRTHDKDPGPRESPADLGLVGS
jgi:hypothetical protein